MMEEGRATMSGDHVVMVGAASKGIIQRDHQHNAVVYHDVFSPNPFDRVTDEDLESYRQTVGKKDKGEEITPESAAADQSSPGVRVEEGECPRGSRKCLCFDFSFVLQLERRQQRTPSHPQVGPLT